MKIVVVHGGAAAGHYARPCCEWARRAWAGMDGYRIHAGLAGNRPYVLPDSDPRGMPLNVCPNCSAAVEQLSLGEMEKQTWPRSAT